jgi:Tfp pilus assembly protein FimT
MRIRHNNRGFTVIELVLTGVIIALMTGVYLTFVDFTDTALDRATRRFESDLRYAQQIATAEEVNCGIITTGNNTYNVYRGNPGTLLLDPHTQQAMSVDFVASFDSVAFAGPYQVEFDILGRPVLGAGQQMTLSLNNQNRSVTVLTTTGYVQVQ